MAAQPTFLDHVIELRARLFWVVASILVASGIGYGIQNQIIHALVKPLGRQQLFYLTPVGGLTFIFRISFYFGIIVSVPVIVYQLYRFFEPLMPTPRKRSVVLYFFFSTLLAVSGVVFAYFISLPAALHFLTGFHLDHITAMLTVDSYMSFVTTYLLGAAALFQIPLVLLIIDNITPLKPSGLLKYERHVLLAAFIISAIISPTPDMFNQTILALPIIGMYQIGVILIWWKSRRAKKAARQAQVVSPSVTEPTPKKVAPSTPLQKVAKVAPRIDMVSTKQVATVKSKKPPIITPTPVVMAAAKPIHRPLPALPKREVPQRPLQYRQPDRGVRLAQPRSFTSIDGFIMRTQA
jgi:sec-independent protein translocase protein TatC